MAASDSKKKPGDDSTDSTQVDAIDSKSIEQLLDEEERYALERFRAMKVSGTMSADEIGAVLPDAISIRAGNDALLSKSITTTTERAIDNSIQQDPSVLAEALFPVIGQAIRKAIQKFFNETMSGINSGLESTFSIRRLGWRIESWRTKTPYHHIVIQKTVKCRVEQVLLIHRETGLLLQSVVRDGSLLSDDDMVSSMLTAIREFTKDSFTQSGDEEMESLQVGAFHVILVDGPTALLAAVIHGVPSSEVREQLEDAIESVHLRFIESLRSFTGDVSDFDAAIPIIEGCFLTLPISSKKRPPIMAIVILIVLLGSAGYGVFRWIERGLVNREIEKRFRDAPGFVVTDVVRTLRTIRINGMRDVLAATPETVLADLASHARRSDFRFTPFISGEPDFIVRRANNIVGEDNQSVRFRNGQLVLSSSIAAEMRLRLLYILPGVIEIVSLPDLLPDGGKLIEELVIYFQSDSAEFVEGQDETFSVLNSSIKILAEFRNDFTADISLEIIGHAAGDVNDEESIALSMSRANNVLNSLEQDGIDGAWIRAVGVGSAQPAEDEVDGTEQGINRRVSFQLIFP